MGSRSKRPDRRQTIVAAAIQRIAQDGLEGLRIRDVAADAGIHHATLLHHFPTKENLIQAVVDSFVDRFSATDIAPLAGPPDERLRSHHAAIRARIGAAPEIFVVFNELSTRAQRDETVARALRPTIEGWADYLRSIARAAVEGGDGHTRCPETEVWIELEMATIKGFCVRLGEEGCLRRGGESCAALLDRFDGAMRRLENLFAAGSGSSPAGPAAAASHRRRGSHLDEARVVRRSPRQPTTRR